MGEPGIGSVLAEYGAGYWPSKELGIGWVPTNLPLFSTLIGLSRLLSSLLLFILLDFAY